MDVNTLELRANIFRDLNVLLDNEKALRSLSSFLSMLKKTVVENRTYSIEELHERIAKAEAEIAAGDVLTNEEANAEIEKLLPWLK